MSPASRYRWDVSFNFEVCCPATKPQGWAPLHASAYYLGYNDLILTGMLQVRIGWLAHAMRLLLKHRRSQNCDEDEEAADIHDLSPSQIKDLMYDALNVENHKNLTWLQQKEIAGALNKVRFIQSRSGVRDPGPLAPCGATKY